MHAPPLPPGTLFAGYQTWKVLHPCAHECRADLAPNIACACHISAHTCSSLRPGNIYTCVQQPASIRPGPVPEPDWFFRDAVPRASHTPYTPAISIHATHTPQLWTFARHPTCPTFLITHHLGLVTDAALAHPNPDSAEQGSCHLQAAASREHSRHLQLVIECPGGPPAMTVPRTPRPTTTTATHHHPHHHRSVL